MRYWVRATPSGTGRLPVTGTPAANGTTAKFVDETGNTIQTRATFTFGPLCELAITPGVSLSGGGVPTRALVGGMTASRLNDQSIISWSTAGESGTAAFRLARWDPAAGTWRVVNQTPVPALVDAPQGGVYRLADPEALPGQTYQYRIEELDVHGRVLDYGPFTVTIPEPASNPDVVAAPPVDASGSRTPHPRQRRDADTPNVKPEHFKTAVAGKTAAGGTRPEAAKVAVRADGLHAVTFDALAEALALPRAAVEALAHRGRLEITSGGRLVTYLTDLAPGAIVFYGRRLDSPYADANVYRVAVGRGRLMARADGAPPAAVAPGLTFATTQDAEEDHLPAPAVTRNPESDYWFWDYLFADHPTQGAKTFTVPTPAPAGTGAAALAVRLHGGTDTGFGTDHQVAVRLNGVNVGTARWDGLTAHSLRFTIDPAILRDGANTVELAAQLNEGIPYSLVYVDGFAVDYVRQARADTDRLRLAPGGLAPHAVAVDGFTTDAIVVLDITDPDAPVLQPAAAERAGRNWRVCFRCQPRHEYFAASVGTAAAVTAVSPDWPSRLRDTEPGADYVVITPQSLLGPAEALAAYRASQGHRALVVDIADIYDEFNHGRSSPQAIRDFLAWAVAHWSVPPRFVVLAGRGTYDYRDLEGFGDNLLPPLYLGTTHGLAAADNRFACVAGDDNVPDLAVGRLPAATAAELQAMVDKIIAYEAQPDGAWSRRALVVADNPDPAGDFPADSETVAAELPPWLRLRRISLAEQTALEAREALVSGIATGAGLVNYLGHGGVDRLAAEGVLRLDDIPSLANGARLPLVLAFTCAAGECTIPGYPGLGEALLARPAGGAIAVYAPAGLSDNTAAVELNAALAAELGRGHAMLGDAIRAALAAWEPADPAAGYHRDLYILLGDPALRLVR
ncbi:MAG TPA: C25 family cysteine peptidase [Acidobacteriota bacterium]|nr:C25 family cysteine peptidase [Acidobacteriota bacterium]HNU00961.1 C25 family cysteine peptidase [Acidobacteriota bacterium]